MVICFSHCVLTQQPLDIDQHTALMRFYDDLGESQVFFGT
jgi:hypothetical protein